MGNVESAGLLKLVQEGINRPARKMTRKAYIYKNKDLIFAAIDSGAKYSDIQAALAEDGVIVGAQYLKELIGQLKRKQPEYKKPERLKPAAPIEPKRDPHTVDFIDGKNDVEKRINSPAKPLTGADALKMAEEMVTNDEKPKTEKTNYDDLSKDEAMSLLRKLTGR